MFSNLKFRGGYGVTGNQGVGPYATIAKMANGSYAYGTGSGTFTEISNEIADKNLRWEQTAQTDIGIDMGFFNNRLNFSIDYFNKQTKDLLLSVTDAFILGCRNKAVAMLDHLKTRGVELTISATPIDRGGFSWTTNFNFSSYKNKDCSDLGGDATFINSTIESLTGTGIVNNELLRNIEGESMGTFWGHQFLGIYQKETGTRQVWQNNPDESRTQLNTGSGAAQTYTF